LEHEISFTTKRPHSLKKPEKRGFQYYYLYQTERLGVKKNHLITKVASRRLKYTDISGILRPHDYRVVVRSVTSRGISIEMDR